MFRWRWVVALVLTAGFVIGWIVYPSLHVEQTRDVAVPPDGASPEEVVRAYLDALDAHDCDTAERLMTPNSSAESWCEDLAGLADVQLRDVIPEKPRWSGHRDDQQVMQVVVRFDLDWPWLHGDGSMPEGLTTWGYLLVRDSEAESWTIFDQGVA